MKTQNRTRGHWVDSRPHRLVNPAAASDALEDPDPNPPRCPSCNVPYIDHLGVNGVCKQFQTVLGVLRQIAALPPRCSRRARDLASSCVVFLEQCEKERRKNNIQPKAKHK